MGAHVALKPVCTFELCLQTVTSRSASEPMQWFPGPNHDCFTESCSSAWARSSNIDFQPRPTHTDISPGPLNHWTSCTVDDEIVTGFIIVPETENSFCRLMNLCTSSRLRNSFPAVCSPSQVANIKISCYFTEKASFSQIRRLTCLLFSLKS